MNYLKNNSILSSVFISVVISLLAICLWAYGDEIVLFISKVFSYKETNFSWWKLSFVILAGVAFGILTEIRGFKKTAPYFLGFSAIWLTLSFLFAKHKYLDLLAVPVILAPFFISVLVHFKKLWQIDSELTEKLVSLASTGHLMQGKSADLRIESGLKLLETFFPVSEMIVFRCDSKLKFVIFGLPRSKLTGHSPEN
jgi:hypothetical protein